MGVKHAGQDSREGGEVALCPNTSTEGAAAAQASQLLYVRL